MPARLRSDFWIAALRRRAEAAGAFVSIARRGADEAGAIFISVDRRSGTLDLYGPAPQSFLDDDAVTDRLFSPLIKEGSNAEVRARLDQEARFDPDFWLVDIEDREGRPFADIAEDDSAPPPSGIRFTLR